MKKLPLINFVIVLIIAIYLIVHNSQSTDILPEITTERLNIVGKDGKKYIVLSNPEKQALATINGKPSNPEQTARNTAGLLFFNEDGDEIGGLVYGIDSMESYQLLTFDQRKSDQVMALRKDEYLENGKWKRQYGLLLQERSEKQADIIVAELNAINKIADSILRKKRLIKFFQARENLAPQRLFVGRTYDGSVGLFLMDKDNNPRLRICLDKEGKPHIESFDKKGLKNIIQ